MLGVSQAAASQQIKRLEEVLECRLFERRGRKLVLAPAGERLLAANALGGFSAGAFATWSEGIASTGGALRLRMRAQPEVIADAVGRAMMLGVAFAIVSDPDE